MVAHFLENELRVWLDIDGSEYFPALYSFKLEGNKVYLYMELLDNSKCCHCFNTYAAGGQFCQCEIMQKND